MTNYQTVNTPMATRVESLMRVTVGPDDFRKHVTAALGSQMPLVPLDLVATLAGVKMPDAFRVLYALCILDDMDELQGMLCFEKLPVGSPSTDPSRVQAVNHFMDEAVRKWINQSDRNALIADEFRIRPRINKAAEAIRG